MTNWKTTVIGILSLIAATLTAMHEPSILAAIKDPQFQIAVLVGAIGVLAKDYNVTGIGTKATSDQAKDGTKA